MINIINKWCDKKREKGRKKIAESHSFFLSSQPKECESNNQALMIFFIDVVEHSLGIFLLKFVVYSKGLMW